MKASIICVYRRLLLTLKNIWSYCYKKRNKKYKGTKKGSTGLDFENFNNKITSLVNFDTFIKPPLDTKKVSTLTVANGEMIRTTVTKNTFSQLNDKKFYFPNGVVSLPFHHLSFAKRVDFKQKKGQKIEKCFEEEKEHLVRLENTALKNDTRLCLQHQILMSVPNIFNINQKSYFDQHGKTIFKKMQKGLY